MKLSKFSRVLILLLAASLILALASCGAKPEGGDILDEPEITVKYLSGEYAQQLLRDGGEEVLGTIKIRDGKNGKYGLEVARMAIIENASNGGYYIADKNLSLTVPLDSEARVTYIKDAKNGPQIMELDKFIKGVQKDEKSNSHQEKLYKVYIIGGNALMILAKELPKKKG